MDAWDNESIDSWYTSVFHEEKIDAHQRRKHLSWQRACFALLILLGLFPLVLTHCSLAERVERKTWETDVFSTEGTEEEITGCWIFLLVDSPPHSISSYDSSLVILLLLLFLYLHQICGDSYSDNPCQGFLLQDLSQENVCSLLHLLILFLWCFMLKKRIESQNRFTRRKNKKNDHLSWFLLPINSFPFLVLNVNPFLFLYHTSSWFWVPNYEAQKNTEEWESHRQTTKSDKEERNGMMKNSWRRRWRTKMQVWDKTSKERASRDLIALFVSPARTVLELCSGTNRWWWKRIGV